MYTARAILLNMRVLAKYLINMCEIQVIFYNSGAPEMWKIDWIINFVAIGYNIDVDSGRTHVFTLWNKLNHACDFKLMKECN